MCKQASAAAGHSPKVLGNICLAECCQRAGQTVCCFVNARVSSAAARFVWKIWDCKDRQDYSQVMNGSNLLAAACRIFHYNSNHNDLHLRVLLQLLRATEGFASFGYLKQGPIRTSSLSGDAGIYSPSRTLISLALKPVRKKKEDTWF